MTTDGPPPSIPPLKGEGGAPSGAAGQVTQQTGCHREPRHRHLALGEVGGRGGDYFGPPVNLAARFTGVARRNRVIIDERTAGLLPVAEFETRPLPARPIRGFGDLEPFTVRRTRPRH